MIKFEILRDTDGSFECSCNTGYEGSGDVCNRIDECVTGTHKCDANAECVSTIGGFERGKKRPNQPDDAYICQCNEGFEGNLI